jgi:hypothetical protein
MTTRIPYSILQADYAFAPQSDLGPFCTSQNAHLWKERRFWIVSMSRSSPISNPFSYCHRPTMVFQSLFGGRSVACDFADLVQNGFCIRPVAHQRHDLAGLGPRYRDSFERHFAASTTVSRLHIDPPNRLSSPQKRWSRINSVHSLPTLYHLSSEEWHSCSNRHPGQAPNAFGTQSRDLSDICVKHRRCMP